MSQFCTKLMLDNSCFGVSLNLENVGVHVEFACRACVSVEAVSANGFCSLLPSRGNFCSKGRHRWGWLTPALEGTGERGGCLAEITVEEEL